MNARLGCALLFLLLPASLWAGNPPAAGSQNSRSNYAFDQAIQNYLKGDSQKSIQNLDEALHQDPNNQRAKLFLLKILVERGSRLFVAKQYGKAYDYLSRAYHLDPENAQVRQMFEMAARQAAPPPASASVILVPKEMQTQVLKEQAAARVQEQGAPLVTLAPGAAPAAAVAAPPPAPAPDVRTAPAAMLTAATPAESPSQLAEAYAKNAAAMMTLLSAFQQRQERQLEKFMVPMDRLQHLYYQSEQDRKNFLTQMDSRFKSVLGDMSFQRRLVIYGFVAGLGLLAVVVWGFSIIVLRLRSRREELIIKYQQEMLKMVRDMAALPGGGVSALTGVPGVPLRLDAPPAAGLLTGPAPAGFPGSPGQLGRLEYALAQGNFKEKALAAMAYLSSDTEKALDIIGQLLKDPDAFQRESMAYALGQQFHPLTTEFLLAALKDPESRVAEAAKASLQRWEQQAGDALPPDVRRILQGWNKGKSGGHKDKSKE